MTDYAIQQVVNALSAGSLYALMAVGLAMVFGILRLINFAHGDLMMIAAYLAVFSIGAGFSFVASLPIIIVGTVIVGLLMERVAYRPLRRAPRLAPLITAIGVSFILQNIIQALFSSSPISVGIVTTKMISWFQLKSASPIVKMWPRGRMLSRIETGAGPFQRRPTFWRMNETPIAVISGANLGAPRSGR